jgi:CHAD domain-containing protein
VASEIELRYAVLDPAEVIAFVSALDADAGIPDESLDLVDRYVDAADGVVGAAGWGVRVRKVGETETLFLKRQIGTEGALHRRDEIEGPAGAGLLPETWPESEARSALTQLLAGAPLEERFRIRQRRDKRYVRVAGSLVETSVDRVTWLDGAKPLGRATLLEVELRDGHEGGLGEIADRLRKLRNVRPEARSKELIGRVLSSPAGVRADDELAEAGRKVMRLHLYRLLAREDGVREGTGTDDVHRMRVATRRLRAAWRLFGDAYRNRIVDTQVEGLRDLAGRLGAVRDLDVQIENLKAHGTDLPESERAALGVLERSWQTQRDAAHAALVKRLRGKAYRGWADEALELTDTAGAGTRRNEGRGPDLVRHSAASRLFRAYERVRAYESRLESADIATFHALRIDGKRLRYALEFLGEPLGGRARPLAATVTAMQDEIGAMNDAHVAATRVRDALAAGGDAMSESERAVVAAYLSTLERAAEHRSEPARDAWASVAGEEFRSGLGKAVARF